MLIEQFIINNHMSHTIYTTTSINRPRHEAGIIAYETDTGKIIISDGDAWHIFSEQETSQEVYDDTHVSIFSHVSIHSKQQILDLLDLRAETI